MNILFVSNDLIAGNLAHVLKKEGHNVKLFIKENGRRLNFDYLVPKTKNWRKELTWVGKDGLIIFDDIGFGKEQDALRARGFKVFGGNSASDALEAHREHAQMIFKKYGMRTVPIKDFANIDDAVAYIKKHPNRWVIKQNDLAPKNMNYTGYFPDGSDTLAVLRNYMANPKLNRERITLQEKVDGVELAVARAFNGKDWVGPIKINQEHKKFFPGDIGPTTSEMGTLAWCEENKNTKIFKETLGKLEPYLRKINFRGEIDINCIVNKKGAFPLEATPRFGSPIVHLHTELQRSPWGEFLYACASGENYEVVWKHGYGIVVLIAVPPFPYAKSNKHSTSYGLNIFFHNIRKSDYDHIHFEEISQAGHDSPQLYISDNRGYVLYVTGRGKTVPEAMKKTYSLIRKIIIPKMMYRNDIGKKFCESDYKKLKSWGFIDRATKMKVERSAC
jgi:phosphoribosylamine--glycine ligase